MEFRKYLEKLRLDKDYSMRQLAEISGVTASALSRIESGERKKPSPLVLKAIAPHLGVSYEHLMSKAGYIEETVEHERYIERQFKDDDGTLADVIRQSKEIISRDQDLFRVVNRAANKLSNDDISAIKAIINSFMADADEKEAQALKTVAIALSKMQYTK